jgi:hypothetical protein
VEVEYERDLLRVKVLSSIYGTLEESLTCASSMGYTRLIDYNNQKSLLDVLHLVVLTLANKMMNKNERYGLN